MPTFNSGQRRASCKHEKRFECARETIKNTATNERKTTIYKQCEACGHIQGESRSHGRR